MASRVVFRNKLGRFISGTQRYTKDVAMVQVVRNREYIIISERMLPPDSLVDVLSQREFESLPEALVDRGFFESGKKYKAWDIANQIDTSKRMRRKNLKFTVVIKEGNRQRQISFYHNIKRNAESSYSIFRRINQEVGIEGYYFYKETPGGKILTDRVGKKVHLVGIRVEEVV